MGDSHKSLDRARELYESGQLSEAEQDLSVQLEAHPDDPSILAFRAYLLYKLERVDESVDLYQRLIKVEPNVAGHYCNLGLIFYKTNRVAEAQHHFENALEKVRYALDAGQKEMVDQITDSDRVHQLFPPNKEDNPLFAIQSSILRKRILRITYRNRKEEVSDY